MTSHARPRVTQAATLVIAMAILAVLAAACGSSPSSTPSGGSPDAGGSARSPSGVAYSRCVRAHGVPNFPDPDGSGRLNKVAMVRAFHEVGLSRAKAATAACASLNPGGPANPALTAPEQQDYLRAAACMRSHGFGGFPDPTFPGGHLDLSIPSTINQDSPQFGRAARICTKLIPAGLPDSAPGH